MFTVYVLYSRKFNKIYVGYTSNLIARLKSHNELGTKGWTLKYRPWEIIYTDEFKTKPEAMKREQELKSGRGREFIWSLIRMRKL
jgi:putative endonuclease